jgi:hypothetical protein
MNIHMDSAYSQGSGYAYGSGTAIAELDVAGEIALPLSEFAISAGMLNGVSTAGADGEATVTITLEASAGASVELCPDATRGGCVNVDGEEETFVCINFTIASEVGGCWACATQCYGDTDCDGDVDLDDFFTFKDAYNTSSGDAAYDECADLDRDGDVDLDDFFDFKDNYNTSPPADC